MSFSKNEFILEKLKEIYNSDDAKNVKELKKQLLSLIEQIENEKSFYINDNDYQTYSNYSNDIKRNYNDVDTSNPIVEVKNLTKQYRGRQKPAINNISFKIYPGQFHAFIGANGAGKTTTIKSIIGAYSKLKYKGNILIHGQPNDSEKAKRNIGYIPEEAKFPKKMTTKEYLELMILLSGFSLKEAQKKSKEILNNLGLSALANKKPNSFSSGQKKKILLAQALIHDPKVLIMDEPAANLDPISREDLFNTILKLQNQGKSIFISSHILDEVNKYVTYTTILDGGNIVYDGVVNPNENLSALYNKYVKQGSIDLYNNDEKKLKTKRKRF